jgi:sigma-B regulation protein RsbU (phosphoserine phosphatase)
MSDLVLRSWLPSLNNVPVACLVALGVLLLVILVEGFRRERTEALLAAASSAAERVRQLQCVLSLLLNERIIGRSGGQLATCLAAELRSDGSMRIVSASHLPPYLNGQELELEGSLPLGAVNVVDPSSRILTLRPGDCLIFFTDGVVEAMNSRNELFGSDRARSISEQPAAAIVQEAQAFGQNDDITVLRIEFIGTPSEAPAEALVAA